MARRKRHGRKGGRAIPAAQALLIGYPVVMAYKKNAGNLTNGTVDALYDLTGYSLTEKKWLDPAKPVYLGIALLAMSTVGSKIANRVGVNKLLKKASGGYIKLM